MNDNNPCATTAAWKSTFTAALAEHVQQVNYTTSILTQEAHGDIVDFLLHVEEHSNETTQGIKRKRALKDEAGMKAAQAKKSKQNRWKNKYELLLSNNNNNTLVFAGEPQVVVSHTGRMFDDILQCHVIDESSSAQHHHHAGRRRTEIKVKEKHGKSIPREVILLFLNHCIVCRTKRPAPRHLQEPQLLLSSIMDGGTTPPIRLGLLDESAPLSSWEQEVERQEKKLILMKEELARRREIETAEKKLKLMKEEFAQKYSKSELQG